MSKISETLVACLTVAMPLLAGTPLLQVSYVRAQGSPGYEVTVTNVYTVAATAYVLESVSSQSSSVGARTGVWVETVPGSPSEKPLGSGESRTWRLGPDGTPGREASGFKVMAVIYADGQTAGAPAYVERFMAERRQLLREIPKIIGSLNQLQQEQAPDPRFWIVHFEQQEQSNTSELKQYGLGPPRDRASGSVLRALKSRPKQAIKEEAAHLSRILRQWYDSLEKSQPPLQ